MDVYYDHTDDVIFLGKFVANTWVLKPKSGYSSDEEFLNNSISYSVCNYALGRCWNLLPKDPLDILEDIVNDYEVTSIFCKQEINKVNYNAAYQAVKKIRNALLERRGLPIQ